MECLDRFNRKMKLSGGSLRNESIKSSQELLKETFADDASFALGVYFWEPKLKTYDHKSPLGIRLYGKSFSNANGVTVKFQTLIDSPVIVGDIIYDSIADEYFICIESFNVDGVHWRGKFNLCNWILKWQDANGDILEYPCTDINSTQYNSGEQSNTRFTIGSSQHMVTLPCDENTVKLKSPQRFFLDKNMDEPTSFVVTQNDTTSYNFGKKGLVKVTLLECERNNEADRYDLGICDYVDKNELKTDNSDNKKVSKSVISYNTTTIKSGGSLQSFVGHFFDDDGNEIDGVVAEWSIICDFSDALDTVDNGNEIKIGIDDDAYIDDEFKIVLTDSDGNYPSSLIIKIGSLL